MMQQKIEKRELVAGLDLGKRQDPSAFALFEVSKTTYKEKSDVIDDPLYGRITETIIGNPLRGPGNRTAKDKRDALRKYKLILLHRWDLGTDYRVIADWVCKAYSRPINLGGLAGTTLAVDETGVGTAVVEMIIAEMGIGMLCSRCNGLGIERVNSEWEPCRGCSGGGSSKGRANIRPVSITGGKNWTENGRAGWNVPKKELVSVIQSLMGTERLKIDERVSYCQMLIKEFENFKVKIRETGSESFEAWRESDHDDMVLACAIALWVREKGMVDLWIK